MKSIEITLRILEKEVAELKHQMKLIKPKEPLSIMEVAKILNRSPFTIRIWAQKYSWFGSKTGRRWFFYWPQIDRLREEKRMMYRQ